MAPRAELLERTPVRTCRLGGPPLPGIGRGAENAAAQHIIFARAIPGWTSLAVIISLLSGAQMLFLGVVDEYLGQVHAEAKHRPLYVVRQTSIPEMRAANREPRARTVG